MHGQTGLQVDAGNAGEGFGNKNAVGKGGGVFRAGKQRVRIGGGDLAAEQIYPCVAAQQVAECGDVCLLYTSWASAIGILRLSPSGIS